jgi:hypothetical protein
MITKRDRQWVSREVAGGGAGVSSVAGSGASDELTDRDERGGEVEVEVDDGAIAVGAAADLAVPVHPRVCSFYHPPFAGLDRCRDAFAGDVGVEPEFVEQVPARVLS